MEVQFRNDHEGSVTFFVKEKIDNQTFNMGFEELDRDRDNIYFNIYVSLYNKRKHSSINEDEKAITGKNPARTVAVGLKAYRELENEIIRFYGKKKNIHLIVCWIDNRRRNAYYKVLSKKGFHFDRYDNYKVLRKKIPKGSIIIDD